MDLLVNTIKAAALVHTVKCLSSYLNPVHQLYCTFSSGLSDVAVDTILVQACQNELSRIILSYSYSVNGHFKDTCSQVLISSYSSMKVAYTGVSLSRLVALKSTVVYTTPTVIFLALLSSPSLSAPSMKQYVCCHHDEAALS